MGILLRPFRACPTLPGMIGTEEAAFAALVRRILPRGRLLRAWPLAGGISAEVTALEVAEEGGTQRLVLRRHGAADRRFNPRIAADEYRLLAQLQAAGLPAPRPRYLDESGALFGFPSLVVDYVEGAALATPDGLPQLAEALAAIHGLAAEGFAFLPRQAKVCAEDLAQDPAEPDEALQEALVRARLKALWPFPKRHPPTLLHGDFWPGNALFHAGRLSAVIDWEDAMQGDPLSDLANARLEILWAFGRDAMEAFTQDYLAARPLDTAALPHWDLYSALKPAGRLAGWGLPAERQAAMIVQHRWFVAQSLARL